MNIEEALKVAREEGKEVGLRKALKLTEKVRQTEKEKRLNIERRRNFSDEEVKIMRAEDKLIMIISGLIEMEMQNGD